MGKQNYLFSNKDLRMLILPLIGDQFLQAFVGLADSIMVASVGEAAVSGVSLVDNIMWLLITVFVAVATGGAIISGQYFGKNKEEMACKAANQLLLFILKTSLLVTFLGYMARNIIIDVVFGNIEADVMYNCNVYMLIVFASIPMIALYNAGTAIFRTMGDSTVAMKTSMIMNTINIGGNALLIFGLHCGIEGVAIPTTFSRGVACILILYYLNRKKNKIYILHPISLKTDWGLLKKILYIGIPNGLENSMFQLGKILVLSVVSGFGTASIAANAVANNIATFSILPGTAMGYAMLAVAAQCIGAGDYQQASYYTKKLTKLVYVCLWISNIIVVLLLPTIIQIYGLSQEASEYTYKILVYYCLCVITVWPLSFFIPNTLRAAADVQFPMVLSIISMWIFRIGCSVVFAVYFNMGVFGIWVAMSVDWLFRGICFTIRYKKGKWKQISMV